MASKNETSLPLEKMIPSYGKLKAQIKEDTKAADLLNSRIKTMMLKKKLAKKEAGGYVVSITSRTSESFDEEQLIQLCKENKKLSGCIKQREYVDMDELESLIYDKKVPKSVLMEMDKLRIRKTTEYLTVAKSEEK